MTDHRRAQQKKAALLREKAKVRKQVFVTGALVCSWFAAMTVYFLIYTNKNSKQLFENDYNKREEALLEKNVRGKIYAASGEVLAETIQDQDGNDVRSYPYKNLFSHIVGYTYKGGSGVEQLAQGSAKLKEGTGQLAEGGSKLDEGVDSLKDGADQLHEGMEEFNEEGIEKITDFLEGDVKEVLERLEDVKDAGSRYRLFTESGENTEGNVKFIIETSGIE